MGKSGTSRGRTPLQHRDARVDQLVEVVRQDLAREADGDALGTLRQQQRELHRQEDRLLVAAVVARLPLGGLGVEDHVERELAQARLDVARCGGGVAGEDVAPVALAVDQQVLLAQLHERVADAGIAVRVVLHRVPDDVRHLVVAAIVELLHRMQDAALHGLQAVVQCGHGPLEDHVAGIVQEPLTVHAAHAEGARLAHAGHALVRLWRRCCAGAFGGDSSSCPSFFGFSSFIMTYSSAVAQKFPRASAKIWISTLIS